MVFADQISAFVKKTQTRADLYVQYVEEEAYTELTKELAKVLPDETPVDTGALARGYQFKTNDDGELVVSNKEFYAVAIKRHGHDLGETVIKEAEKIIQSSAFRKKVQSQALSRLPAE